MSARLSQEPPIRPVAEQSVVLRVQAEQIAADALAMSRIGQKPGFIDPDKVQLLLAALLDGNYRETACKLAGVPKGSFYRWLEMAEHGDEGAIALRDAVEKAEAAAENEMVQAVRAAGKHPQYWAAAATHLERKFPERWGKRDEAAMTAKVQVSIGGVSQAQVLVGVQVRGEGELSPVTFASVEGRNPDANPLSPQAYASPSRLINSDYVNLSESVPGASGPVLESGARLDGGPRSGGVAPLPGAGGSGVKGRRAVRKEKKAKA